MINPFNPTTVPGLMGPLAGLLKGLSDDNPKSPLGAPSMVLSEDELNVDPISNRDVFKDKRYFSGNRAVAEVERRIGRELEPRFKDLVREEGFFAGRYFDDRAKDPVETAGVGQTGEYLNMPLSQVFKKQESQLKSVIPTYEDQPEEVKSALLSAKYRGDLNPKYKWVKHFNNGNYSEAAKEILDHEEYRSRKKKNPDDGVVKRLDHISKILSSIKKK